MSETFSEMVTRLFVKPDTPMLKMVHGALGLLTEMGEIEQEKDDSSRELEIGDALFYIEAVRQQCCYCFTSGAAYQTESGDPFSDVGSIIKAAWIYGRPFNSSQMLSLLDRCEDFFLDSYMTFDLNKCEAAVMHKLQARYPNGYSDQAANERADTNGKS